MSTKSCKRYVILFDRWSYAATLLCYIAFFLIIWILRVPLKRTSDYPEQFKTPLLRKNQLEDSFVIKMKNSNFNSDKSDNIGTLLNEKKEYLVNPNNNDNLHKDHVDILTSVFIRYANIYINMFVLIYVYNHRKLFNFFTKNVSRLVKIIELIY